MSETILTAAKLIELPEGSLPEHGITILAYLAEDGTREFGWCTHGDPMLGETIGLITLANHAIIHSAEEDEE